MATQSAQISSSQGFADGPSDQSPAGDARFPVTMDSQAPGIAVEGVGHNMKDTEQNLERHRGHSAFSGCSDRVSSAPDSFGVVASTTAPLRQNTSPVKISPVSERIKALEALASKQTSDTWSDGGFLLFKERHYEKSPTESFSPFQKRDASSDQDSPESPFEVLGDPRRGSDYEDTADWMRAHLPPAPHFDTVPDLDNKAASHSAASEECECPEMQTAAAIVANVPDAFMDIPGTTSNQKDASEQPVQASAEEESEFDMSFLPTAYMWDKQEKMDHETQEPTKIPDFKESKLPPSPPPPAGFGSPTPPPSPPTVQPVALEVAAPWNSEVEPVEIVDVDSSGESDDTVIEDAVSIHVPVSSHPVSIAPSLINEENEMQGMKQEKQPILVPVINVIETDEQVLSDDDMDDEAEEEGFQVVTDLVEEQSPELQPDEGNSDQQTDFITDATLELHKNDVPNTSSSASKTNSGLETSECNDENPSPLAAYIVDTSLQYDDVKHKCQTEKALSTSEDLLCKETESCAVPEHPKDSDILEVQSFATENAQSENKSHYTEVSSDMIMESSPDLLNHEQEETQSRFLGSEANASIDSREHISFGFTHSLEESKVDAKHTALTDRADVLQEALNTREPVPQSDKEAGDSFCPKLPDMLMDMDLTLDNKTSVLSHDYGLQNQADVVTLLDSHKNIEECSTEIVANSGDDPKVTAKDLVAKQDCCQPSPQSFSQDAFSDFQDHCETAKLEVDVDYSSDVTNSHEIQKQHEVLTGQDVSYQKSELSFSGVVKTHDDYARESSPEVPSDPESIKPEYAISVHTDSFVEFMRECLKSRQDVDHRICSVAEEGPETGATLSHSQPVMVLDVEQERLTICALKELGSSQEEDEDLLFMTKSLQATTDKEEDSALTINRTTIVPMHPPSLSSGNASVQDEEVDVIDAWVADAYHLAEHVLAAILTHFSVKELVYWRDPKKTGVVFGVSLLLLLSLAAFSVISVVSYLLLALLCVTISFRIYKSVVQAVQKSNEGHPFKVLMEKDVSVPPETFRKHVDICLSYVNQALRYLSRLFLVEDLVDSIKLAVVMWLLTYVGAVFNGITVLILVDILLFTMPLAYEKNKTQIDKYMDIARTQFNTIVTKLQEKLPGAKRKAE